MIYDTLEIYHTFFYHTALISLTHLDPAVLGFLNANCETALSYDRTFDFRKQQFLGASEIPQPLRLNPLNSFRQHNTPPTPPPPPNKTKQPKQKNDQIPRLHRHPQQPRQTNRRRHPPFAHLHAHNAKNQPHIPAPTRLLLRPLPGRGDHGFTRNPPLPERQSPSRDRSASSLAGGTSSWRRDNGR